MQTDIPLKRLTLLRGGDFLALLGLPAAQLLQVETLELPASATRLDNVLRVRSAAGQEFLQVVEWQGYRDPAVLWRVAGYMAWLGQRSPSLAVTGTVIYLSPEDDMGDQLLQVIDDVVLHRWTMRTVRLWEQSAAAAVAAGLPGLAVLSPLMQGATAELVDEALNLVMRTAPVDQQSDLMAILGVFAEPFIATETFVRKVGKERLMASSLASYLLADREAEIEARAQAAALQQALEEAVMARFPNAPLIIVRDIRRVIDADQLRALIVAVIQAADLAEFEARLAEAAA